MAMRRAINSSGARVEEENLFAARADDEKEVKVRQHQESRLVRVVFFFGMLCFVFIVAIVKLNHSPSNKYHSASIRRRQKQTLVRQQPDANVLLPLNSIYRLFVQDNQGQEVSLEQYAGMVSLVVNVASA
jgi:uncharacterized membrane protein